MTDFRGSHDGTGLHIAVVSAEFSEKAGGALDTLRQTCWQTLGELGATHDTFYCPGAFEIPTVAARLARSGRYAAVITLGVVVRGETAHFDFVAGECARGVAAIGRETGVPTIFGVLTTETTAQAIARGHLGAEYARGAIAMARLMRTAAEL